MDGRSIGRARAGGHPRGRGPPQHLDGQVGRDADLAGEADIRAQARLTREPGLFDLAHRFELARDHLDPAGGSAGIPAATVQDVDPGVLDGQDELLPRLDFERLLPNDRHRRHRSWTPRTARPRSPRFPRVQTRTRPGKRTTTNGARGESDFLPPGPVMRITPRS